MYANVKTCVCYCLDATLTFIQSLYNVNESCGMVKIVLVLSNASLNDVIIRVDNFDDTAASKLCIV